MLKAFRLFYLLNSEKYVDKVGSFGLVGLFILLGYSNAQK